MEIIVYQVGNSLNGNINHQFPSSPGEKSTTQYTLNFNRACRKFTLTGGATVENTGTYLLNFNIASSFGYDLQSNTLNSSAGLCQAQER